MIKEVLNLIKELPDSDSHVFRDEDGWTVTSEWLCGGFAGRGFTALCKEGAVQEMINYLDRHINHNSVVGCIVKKSGWPDIVEMKSFLLLPKSKEKE
jgi:hypothetical protein